MTDQPKIAFVQDALPYQGGAEKVLAAALQVFPQAPVYTFVYNREAFRGTIFEDHQILSSFIDRLPGAHRNHRLFFPLMPLALRRFDLSHFDIVISFSYAFAHAVPIQPHQLHISYIHTPLRYAWNDQLLLYRSPVPLKRLALGLNPFLAIFRQWDRSMSARSDFFLTNSHWMAGRIWHAYQRKAEVLYPPVDTERFHPCYPRQDYYIALSRLVEYKRMDLVVEAFTRLGYPLLIIGEGPQLKALQARSGTNIHFLGWQPVERLAKLLGRAKGFVHAGEEDFGIAMAEAQAAGCPVIALKRGGAPEIVCDGQSGQLFGEQNIDSLCEAIERFDRQGVEWGPGEIQACVQRFGRSRFQAELAWTVREKWEMKREQKLPFPFPSRIQELPGC